MRSTKPSQSLEVPMPPDEPREETTMDDGQDERHATEAVEQSAKIRKLLVPLLPHESLFQGIDRLKTEREAWEERAREADKQVQGAFDALLWISEAPNRDEDCDEQVVALAVYARQALGPLETGNSLEASEVVDAT